MLRICTTRVLWTADIDCHPFSAKVEYCKIYILFRIDGSYICIFVDLASLNHSLIERSAETNATVLALHCELECFSFQHSKRHISTD